MTASTDIRHLSSPRDGLPPLADTPGAIEEVALALATGSGPVCVDTERASGFRFDDRAWLVQLRRSGAGTHLVDPASVREAGELLAPVMNRTPWVLHAAHTDLPALTSLGWRTPQLHDTQIAGRLLGFGQVGLAGMLEQLLGVTVAKDKGQENWSVRPLPTDMLTYAALDVEMLPELLDAALSHLEQRGEEEGRDRLNWYRQECDHIRGLWTHPVQVTDWSQLRGIKAVRDPRGLELARRLTAIRTTLARERDIPPEKILRSSMIVEMAKDPFAAEDLLNGGGASFRGAASTGRKVASGHVGPRLSRELRARLLGGIHEALSVKASSLPTPARAPRGHPDHRTWVSDHPVAARLLTEFRGIVDGLSADLGLHPSELLVSRSVRSLAWETSQALTQPPLGGSAAASLEDPVGWAEERLGGILVSEGSREWQIDLLIPECVPALATELPR